MEGDLTLSYKDFLKTKETKDIDSGFEISKNEINNILFDFQKDIVKWSIKRGRAAIFADCGLGKTFMQLEWARIVNKQIKKPILILAPLAVSKQTKQEGNKIFIDVNICSSQDDACNLINITNYEKLHKFDLSKFGGIVLDESSILKSYSGKIRNEIIDSTKKMQYKLACTATPAPNDFMELGNHSEFLGAMNRTEMLAMFFINDCDSTQKWRLKKHAEQEFWKWISSWAVMIRQPSDIGYKDNNFKLPNLNINEHVIECSNPSNGELFVFEAKSLQDRQKARKASLKDRCEKAKNIIENSKENTWLLWCNLNDESALLKSLIKNAVEVKGSDKDEYKEKEMLKFSNGINKILISKPKISGFGMNWQHCNNVIFVGLSDSYEQYYQAVRRCWRFGQKKEVNVHIVVSDAEGSIVKNIQRKERDAVKMAEEMTKNMSLYVKENLSNKKERNEMVKIKEVREKDFILYEGDCVDVSNDFNDEEVDYSIFSPPFAELYTYSDKNQDMGNSKNYDEFFKHFKFLVDQLYRVTKKGRLCSFHCIDIPAMKERDGYIGLKDFPGDLIKCFQSKGWIYHSRVVIWKNPLVEATRTKALGLMHKQLCKDSSRCRQGLPDYVITMRKPGDNKELINNGEGFKEFIGTDKPKETGLKFSHEVWRRYASPVWMDINQSNTLQKRSAREAKDEKHICPLQLDTIARCIELWSNKGETVFTPFAGIGSEIYQALKMDRKGIGIELKESYFNQAVKNCKIAKESVNLELF